jgi:hypothetical protein
MRKALFFALIIFLISPVSHAQAYIGIEGGGVLCVPPGNPKGGPDNLLAAQRTVSYSFQGGIWSDIRLSDYLDFQPHLMFSRQGSSLMESSASGHSGYMWFDYLEVPLNLMYRIPVGYDDFLLGAGPYVALGLVGTYSYEMDSLSGAKSTLEGKVLFRGVDPSTGSDNLHFRPFDAGYNATLSYQFSFGLTFGLRYSRGLINMLPSGTGHMQNQYAGLSLGYLFGYNTKR